MSDHQRSHPRAEIVAHGRFSGPNGKSSQVAFLDLSEKGCRFQDFSRILSKGDGLKVWISQMGPFEGVVRWRIKAEVGVKFIRPIYGPVFEHLTAELGWADATSHRKNLS